MARKAPAVSLDGILPGQWREVLIYAPEGHCPKPLPHGGYGGTIVVSRELEAVTRSVVGVTHDPTSGGRVSDAAYVVLKLILPRPDLWPAVIAMTRIGSCTLAAIHDLLDTHQVGR